MNTRHCPEARSGCNYPEGECTGDCFRPRRVRAGGPPPTYLPPPEPEDDLSINAVELAWVAIAAFITVLLMLAVMGWPL